MAAFLTVAPVDAYFGTCRYSAALGAGCSRVTVCDCKTFSRGGVFAAPTGSADEAPSKESSLECRLDSLKGKSVSQVESGHGGGMSWSSDACTFASDGAYSVIVAGTPHTDSIFEADDGLNEKQRVAWALLGAYAAVADADTETMHAALLKGLGGVSGSFALVMHDRTRHRVVAARDKSGGQQLLWGMTADAALVFSTTTESAIDQVVNPQAFPAGCCFVSDVDANAYNVFLKGACPGALTSFARAKAIPRASSSSGGFCRIMSGTDLAQISSKMGRTPSFTDLAPAAMRGAAR